MVIYLVMMEYEYFEKTLNEEIFEKSKSKLLENIAEHPNRYLGLFRPTKPRAKILQNLLQSHEIRMGNAFEVLIRRYLEIMDYELLPSRYKLNDKDLDIDQCFRKDGKVYFIEQKIRDDHDSSKKTGQIRNFENKVNAMMKAYGEDNLTGIFYFIDPDLNKNKKYYSEELNKIQESYNVKTELQYGKQLFYYLGNSGIWDEILEYLKRWKDSIPDLPETNFDKEPEETFEEIKNISTSTFRTISSDDEIYEDLVLTIFPEKATLRLLLGYFSKNFDKTIYQTLYTLLDRRLNP